MFTSFASIVYTDTVKHPMELESLQLNLKKGFSQNSQQETEGYFWAVMPYKGLMIQYPIFYSHFSFLKEQVCLCDVTAVCYRDLFQTFTVLKIDLFQLQGAL